MANPPSIGDSKTKFQRIRQMYDLPTDRESIVKRVQSILELGGVQKLSIELGHPIQVERLIKPGAETPQELPEESEFARAMSSEITDLPVDGLDPFTYLFSAFQTISAKQMRAVVFLVADTNVVKKWLSLPSMVVLTELFGVRVHVESQVPRDVILMVAEELDTDSPSTLSVRLVMDDVKGKKK